MICPKCQNVMKTVDKGGVHIEQCEGCRGVFLDRGELERIVEAENAYYAAAPAVPPPYQPTGGPQPAPPTTSPSQPVPPTKQYGYADSPKPYRGGPGPYADSPRPYRGGPGHYADSPRPYRHGHYPDSPKHYGGYRDSPRPYGGHGYGHRRKRSFLEGLFD